jgi:hypothetical protein
VIPRLMILPRSDHLVALDRDRQKAIAETVNFVRDGTLPPERDLPG